MTGWLVARRLLGCFLLATSSGVACNHDRQDDEPTTQGDESVAAFELEVLGARTCPLPAHLDPKNVRIISYRVRVVGKHPGRVPANYFYASVVTRDGDRYLASYEGCGPVLSANPLPVGASAEGMLNFPLPPSKTPELLTYAPELVGMKASDAQQDVPLSNTYKAESDEEDEP